MILTCICAVGEDQRLSGHPTVTPWLSFQLTETKHLDHSGLFSL
jgi:hypothetical protein